MAVPAKNAESSAIGGVEPNRASQQRKYYGGDHIEKKDNADGLRNFIVVRIDYRGRSRNS